MSPEPPVQSDVRGGRPLTTRRLLWGLAAAFLLLVLVAAFGAWRMIRGAEETIARHRARLPAEHAAIVALPRGRPPLLEPAQEGEASAVMEAFLAAVEAVPKAERDKLEQTDPDPAPPEEIAAVVAAHPEPVVALKPLLHVRSAPPAPTADVERWWAPMHRWQEGSRWLTAAAKRAVDLGDGRSAREIAVLHVAFGQEVAQAGNFVAVLVGGAIERRGTNQLISALAMPPIDADEARRLGRGLEAGDAARPSFETVVRTERYMIRHQLASSSSALGSSSHFQSELGWRRLWSMDVFRAELLDAWDAALDATASAVSDPRADASSGWARAQAVADSKPVGLRGELAALALVVRRAGVLRAHAQVARVALAVAEYTARRGSLPAGLHDLVPDFLSAVPADPCDGAPLRYAGGKVWSVGMDGKDDGGTPPSDPEDDLGRDGDIVAPAPRLR